MNDKTERNRLAILRILQDAIEPVSGQKITEHLFSIGNKISERTVRFYLLQLDQEGLTRYIGRHGRVITEKGSQELGKARIFEKVGFLAAKIDQMTYSMNFNLDRREGTVVLNLSMLKKQDLKSACPIVMKVFESGYAMGNLMGLMNEGESIGAITIPEKYVGIGTVCSISLNGVLLHYGIPVTSRFGGLLEIRDNRSSRFIEIIEYGGTSLDPLDIFIQSEMTDVEGVIEKGNGKVGASFRELPIASREATVDIAQNLVNAGLGGIMALSWPDQTLMEIPINEGRIGAIIIGGLNPVAILKERGFSVRSKPLSGLVEYNTLFHYSELLVRANKILKSKACVL